MKHVKKISCQTCISYHACQALQCDPDCWKGKKTTSMEEKVATRKEIAKWRKQVSKMYNL